MTAKDLIKQEEGLRLKAYPDPASGGDPWTIGYGHTSGVKKTDLITKEQAEDFLDEDMLNAYSVVDRVVKVPLSPQQRDALCSFVFNVGGGAFSKSTMLRLLNQGEYIKAANEFDRWTKAAGRTMPGLVKRRGKEKSLFLSGTNQIIEPFPIEEKPVAPFLVAAIPALLQALPEFAKIFQKDNVPERNVEALEKAVDIVIQSTGAANVQEAVEIVQANPVVAQQANTELRKSRAELLDLMERMAAMDETSIKDARVFYKEDKPVYKGWHFVHILSLLFVILGGGAALYVVGVSQDPTERVMALQTLLIVGFASVAGFWLGSSRSSQMKDTLNKDL